MRGEREDDKRGLNAVSFDVACNGKEKSKLRSKHAGNGVDLPSSSLPTPPLYTRITGGVEDDVGRLRGDLRARGVQCQGRHLVEQLAVCTFRQGKMKRERG